MWWKRSWQAMRAEVQAKRERIRRTIVWCDGGVGLSRLGRWYIVWVLRGDDFQRVWPFERYATLQAAIDRATEIARERLGSIHQAYNSLLLGGVTGHGSPREHSESQASRGSS